MNRVILIGRLTDDPELSTTPTGIQLCRFRLAVPRAYKTADQDTDFVNIIVWRTQAENCNRYLFKGSQCAVVGSLQTRTYDKDGQRRYITEVVADNVEFLARADGTRTTQSSSAPAGRKSSNELVPADDTDGELPF